MIDVQKSKFDKKRDFLSVCNFHIRFHAQEIAENVERGLSK